MIRNTKGKWLNSDVFRKEAIKFQKNNVYVTAPFYTPDWFSYWEEQLQRCINGYEVEGEKVTGHHYFYLNFTQIQSVENATDEESVVANKINKPPDFWDGDYNYFWSLEIAKNGLFTKNTQVKSTQEEKDIYNSFQKQIKDLKETIGENYQKSKEYLILKTQRDDISEQVLKRLNLQVKPHLDYLDGGYHMIVGKSRRRGYSYKDGAICANVYNTERNAKIIIGAFEKKFLYPNGTMGMASDYINFLNEHTGWAKSRDETDKIEHKKASYKTTENGVIVYKGYKSELLALSFRDNPDAARGKDAKIVLLEEAGAFPNLKDCYNAIYPALTAGTKITGQIIVFGTGGDMESGTVDYADMFYNPAAYRMLPFINIWDEEAQNSTCGFFHPVTWNMEGYYDNQGNSDIEKAIKWEINRRKTLLENSSSTALLQKHVQEYPFCPSEAFLTVSTNNFPVVELRNQLNKVIHEKLQFKFGTNVYFERKEGVLIALPDLKNTLQPIINYKSKLTDLTGCPIIYEYPVANPPKGLYKIGYDPYRQDLSSGVSLAAIYVYKTVHKNTSTKNIIVAEYIGRPQEADDVNRIASQLAELYNAEIMHENEVTHVKNYFRHIKKLNQLAVQPDAVISKNIKNSKVARVYGCHMTDQLKDAGEKYIKDNLLQIVDYDENENPVLNLDKIYSVGLLEELIQYNRKGNFDRCVVKETKITTFEGIKNIEDIKIGELVLTVNGTYKKVTNLFKSESTNNIVELSIVGQYENIKVTDNHPVLIASTNKTKHSCRLQSFNNINYVNAATLVNKYQFCLIPKRKNLKDNLYSNDLLYLIGWCLGDGYVNKKNNNISICLQHNQEEIADKLMSIIDNYTFNENLTKQSDYIKNNKVAKSNRTYSYVKTIKVVKDGYIKLYKTSKKLTDLLLFIGCNPNSKKINSELYNSNNLMPLVIGLLEADGHQKFNSLGVSNRCNIEIATCYTDLLLQVRQILVDNNIWSSLSKVKEKDNCKSQIRLNISTNYIDKLLNYYPSLKFKFCNTILQKHAEVLTNAGFWTSIKIVNVNSNKQTVYNIEVEDNHTYIANGIVNHNCMAYMMCMFQVQEDELGKEHDSKENNRIKDVMKMLDNFYKK